MESPIRTIFFILADEFSYASLVCCNGISSSGDRSAYYDVVGAELLCALGSGNSYLVAYVTVCESDAGCYGYEAFAASIVYLTCLEGSAYYAVETCDLSIVSVVENYLVKRLLDEKVVFHSLLAGGGELSYSNKDGMCAVGTGESFKCRFHHCYCAGCVEVGHIHVELGEYRHSLLYGVRNIVKLEVEEDLVTSRLDLLYD